MRKILFFKIFIVAFILNLSFIPNVSGDENNSINNNNKVLLQDGRLIKGTVYDDSDSPLPGVSVAIKGTMSGVVTDANGNFSLEVPSDKNTLVFSFIGMKTEEIEINGQSTLRVVLKPDAIGLEEVVAVGYGVQKKGNLTGSVSVVESEDLNNVPTANAATKLQGRAAGVTVISDNTPGGEATVRIRGFGTINSNKPLFVIDGVPQTDDLNALNGNDIESMVVLKDASSSAIYGVRAANGVIIITTKKGKRGKPKISFSAKYGVQSPANKYDLLNTKEYGEMLWLEQANAHFLNSDNPMYPDHPQYGNGTEPVIPDYILPAGKMEGQVDENDYSYSEGNYNLITRANKEGTDWQDVILRDAPMQDYNLSVSGASDKANYAISMGYLDQRGMAKYTGFTRFTARSNVSLDVSNWLKVGESIGLTYSQKEGNLGNNGEGTALAQTFRTQPIIPVYDVGGNFAGTAAPNTGNGNNPLAILYRAKDNNTKNVKVLGNVFAEAKIIEGLKFKTLLGFDLFNSKWVSRGLKNPEFAEPSSTDNLSVGRYNKVFWNWANTLNYNMVMGLHNVQILLGTETVSYNSDWVNAGRSVFFSTDPDYMVLDAGEGDMSNDGSMNEWATFSLFGRLNYIYNDRYLLEGVVRNDNSSRFSEDNRSGIFPAFSLGWIITEESFFEDVNWLSSLKLRAGWGQNGNDQVDNYNSYSTYRTAMQNASYDLGGTNTSAMAGYYKYRLGNDDAKWETTTTLNFGFDASMGKFAMSFDWFNRNTSDMLLVEPIAAVNGTYQLPSINIGEMENKGFDFSLTYSNNYNDLQYSVKGNISSYKNEVVKISDDPNKVIWGDKLRNKRYTRIEAGHPISSFYGYEVEGIFNTQEEVDNHPKYNPNADGEDSYSAPGMLKYKDVNGDGIITSDDRTYIGSPHPDFTYGLNIDLLYKNWDVNMFFQGVYGNDLINYVRRWTEFTNFRGNRSTKRLYESWTQERYNNGDKISLPMAINNDGVMQEPSSFFIEDGSYFRMKTLQIGYTLPSNFTSKYSVESFRIYGSVTNLFTITDYSGLDPEIRTGNDKLLGVDSGIYPTPRIMTIGVNINF